MTSAIPIKTHRLFPLLIALTCTLAAWGQHKGDVVILYDNDVHCSVAGYPVMAGLHDDLRSRGVEVLVVSSGDFGFGGPIGAVSKGEYIVRLMNAAGYDAACLGNHEFDYGLQQLARIDSLLHAPLLCCNFRSVDGRQPFISFAIQRVGNLQVAFIGVTTPTTIYTSSPNIFRDTAGDYLFNFSDDRLSDLVQRCVDSVRSLGADYVVLLSHLGDSQASFSSVWLISRLQGVDVLLDGHDHHAIPARHVADKGGNPVLLTSTGAHFDHIGMLVLTRDSLGVHNTSMLLSVDSLSHSGCINHSVADTLAAIQADFAARGNRKVASNQQLLVAEEGDLRVCRLRETNLGDFVADAFRRVMNADIGWVNGGGLRANVAAGEVHYNDLLAVCPFGNRLCLTEVAGTDILDALETAVRSLPEAEGCFPQVSGLSFEVDTTIPSSVRLDEHGTFSSVTGKRRVGNVRVDGVPLDPHRRYTIAGTEYLLLNGGDALSFPSRRQLPTEVLTDIEAIERYARMLGGSIGNTYRKAQHRIVLLPQVPTPNSHTSN